MLLGEWPRSDDCGLHSRRDHRPCELSRGKVTWRDRGGAGLKALCKFIYKAWKAWKTPSQLGEDARGEGKEERERHKLSGKVEMAAVGR